MQRTWVTSPRWWIAVGIIAGVVFALAITLGEPGVDFFRSFYPVVGDYLSGATQLYDANNRGVFHPPWVVWMLIPFGLLPYTIGEALLRTLSVLGILAAVWVYTRDRREFLLGAVFALFNLHTFDLLYRGQITGFNALGAALVLPALTMRSPWLMGLGYLCLTVSLPNPIPFALVFLIASFKQWEIRTFLKSLIIPGVVFVLSLIIDGLWMFRWVNNMMVRTPQEEDGTDFFTTIWRMANVLELPAAVPIAITVVVLAVTLFVWLRVLRTEEGDHVLPGAMLWTAAIFIVTPWTLSYRYLLIYAVITPWLLRWRLAAALVLHALTFLPVLRLAIGRENAWIDIAYAVTAWLLVIMAVLPRRERDPTPSASTAPATR